MPVQYQSGLRAQPGATTVDGQVTFSVDILILTGDLEQLDVDYIIADPTSAVFFVNGGKVERMTVPVTASQMTLTNPTRLRCGPGVQLMGAQITVAISCNGILQTYPISCVVGITGYTCPATIAPVMGGSVMPHMAAAMPFGAARPAARRGQGNRGKQAAPKKSVRPTSGKRGGQK